MNITDSERLVLRDFNKDDFSDLMELSINWKSAPGPEFDKWPINEDDCKGFLEYLSTHTVNESQKLGDKDHHFCAIYLKEKEKIIGLLAINPSNDHLLVNKTVDLGHVIHSDFQDNDIDREAIEMIVGFIFRKMIDVEMITTGNFPNEEQIRPLKNLGFIKDDIEDGIYELKRTNWVKNKLNKS